MATFTTDRTTTGAVAKYQEKGVFVDVGTYEASSTASGSVLQMVPVAAGVTVLDMYIVCDALGGSSTLKAGDGTDDDYYITATSSASAAVIRLAAGTAFPKLYTTADTIDITTGGASTTGTITLVVTMTAETTDLT